VDGGPRNTYTLAIVAPEHRRPQTSRLGIDVENQLRVEVQSYGEATVLAVSGELDLASSPMLESGLERVSSTGSGPVIVDLRQLDFMDSTGLSVLVKAHQRAQDDGRRFGLVSGPPQIQRLLSLTGIGERITVVRTPEELLGGD